MSKEAQPPIHVYAAITKDDSGLMKSTSGGVFGTLAEEVIREGGIVYGSSYSDTLYNIEHIPVSTIKDVDKLRGSKYSPSELGNSYNDVLINLEKGRPVFFSGTPCQISSLNTFLKKDYNNLITCNLICFGVPVKQLYSDYIRHLENKYGSKIVSFSFRDKISGWKKSSVSATFENGYKYIRKPGNDAYMIAFSSSIAVRKSCMKCTHKGFPQPGDMTLGDFWGIWNVHPVLDNDKGVSVVLVNTKKGSSFLKKYQNKFFLKEVNLNIALKGNPSLTQPPPANSKRDKFIADYDKYGYEYIEKKYLRPRSTIRKRFSRLKKRIVKMLR